MWVLAENCSQPEFFSERLNVTDRGCPSQRCPGWRERVRRGGGLTPFPRAESLSLGPKTDWYKEAGGRPWVKFSLVQLILWSCHRVRLRLGFPLKLHFCLCLSHPTLIFYCVTQRSLLRPSCQWITCLPIPISCVIPSESSLKQMGGAGRNTVSQSRSKVHSCRASLMACWWRICVPSAGDTGLIPSPGRSHMLWSN